MFSPDGRYLAIASNDGTLRLLDASTGQELRALKHAAPIHGWVFSSDRECLASLCNISTLKIWEINNGFQIRSLDGYTDNVTRLAFSPDGQALTSAAAGNAVVMLDIPTGKESRKLSPHSLCVGLTFNTDGKHLRLGELRRNDHALGRHQR